MRPSHHPGARDNEVVARAPGSDGAGRLWPALARFALLVLMVAAAWAVLRWTALSDLLEREELARALAALAESSWAPPVFFGLWLAVSPLGLPVSPLVFAGAAVFGVGWGWLYNFIGSLAGAAFSFLIARFLGRDLVVQVIGAARLQRAEGFISRHSFWTVLRSRFFPIPFVIINYSAAFVGMRLSSFVVASAIGLAPSLAVYTYFFHALVQVAGPERTGLLRDLLLAMALMLLLTLLPTLLRRRQRRAGPEPSDTASGSAPDRAGDGS